MADESSSLGAAHLDDFWDLHRRLGERYELLLKELRRAKARAGYAERLGRYARICQFHC